MADRDAERAEARRLRSEEGLSGRQIQQRLGVSKTLLQEWLRGVPPPAWTARPTAKDDLRARATVLREEGWSVNDIALELGVARSTAWLWVRHLPLDRDSERARMKRAKGKQLTEGRWAAHREVREQRKAALVAAGAAEVGELSDRELLLLGAAIYWCEGTKTKPWRPDDARVLFTNSDPDLIALFLRFLEGVGVSRRDLRYRVAIHDSADAAAATRWWADRNEIPLDRFYRPALKRHRPATTRHNTGADYHGCLVITVPRARDLYWRIEGIMSGIAVAGAGSHSVSGSDRR
jgi:transposase